MDHQLLQLRDICIIHFLADHLIEAFLLCLFHRDHPGILDGQLPDLQHDPDIIRRRDLCAVLPVNLVAVILRRIVAGGNVDTRDTSQMTYRKGELRCGAK